MFMKPPSENHNLIRWLDGEMHDAERASFEARLNQDPELAKEAEELRSLSASIRTHLPAEMKVPHADFFNSQIQVRIAQMKADETRAKRIESPSWSILLQLLRQPWFAAAGAVALAIVSFILFRPAQETPAESYILSSYTPNERVQARTFHDTAADATVLMLDGLDAVPAERKVSGINVRRSETEPKLAATTLYDDAGTPLLMISCDALGNSLIWAKSPQG
jgi:hypothetical protein